MTNKVEVTVEPTSLKVAPGDTTEATATLRNLGQSVDQFTLSIDGIEPDWYTLPVSSVALFPNDQDNLKILIHPPSVIGTKAGSYPCQIKVNSQENPEEIVTVDLAIDISVLPSLELDISPKRFAGRHGAYQIMIHNPDENEITIGLNAGDTERKLRYRLHPESVTIPSGGRVEVTLEAEFGWLTYLGIGEKEFDFQVRATLPEGRLAENMAIVTGQLVRIPWYSNLTKIKLPWLTRPPVISDFRTTTDDRREFKLIWLIKRATEVKLDDEDVELKGERVVSPAQATSYVLTATNKHGSLSKTVEITPRSIPQAKTSEHIRASLVPSEIQVSAGAMPGQATLQLQNLGDIVDKFLVEIDGFDETWYSRSASSVALMPQATDQVQIVFKPPKSKGVRATTYPFAVTVRSQSNPEDVTSVIGQLEVQPSVELKLSMRPHRVTCRRKGKFRVNIANIGVSNAVLRLEATDLDEGLNFQFKNDNPEVPAWQTVEVPMLARPKRGSKAGEKKRYDINVTATYGEDQSQSVNCELYHNPFMGSWRPVRRAVRIIVVLGAIGVLVYFVLKWGGGWSQLTSSPQTWVNQLVNTFQGWFSR